VSGPSRNRPCPCGSGVKYKKCCGQRVAAATPAARRGSFAPAGAGAATGAGAGGRTAAGAGAATDPRDVGRWLALKHLTRPGERVHPLDDPRIVGAMLGLLPPPRRPDRPPRPADYDRLVDALLADAMDDLAFDDVWLEDGQLVFAGDQDERLDEALEALPARRFDRRRGVWLVPATPALAAPVLALLERHRELRVEDAAWAWLQDNARWTASVGLWERGGEGVFAVVGQGGEPPPELARRARPWHDGWWSLPLDAPSAALLDGLEGAALDARASEAVRLLRAGERVPGARLGLEPDDAGEPLLVLEVGWASAPREAFLALPEAARLPDRAPGVLFVAQAERLAVPADVSLVAEVDGFLAAATVVAPTPEAVVRLDALRAERRRAHAAVALSRAEDAELALPALGGTLEPFQRAGVAYALAQRRTFLADEQGLGKTVQALAALEADGAYPAVVVCPASVKLNWEREARHWVPGRSVAVLSSRRADPASETADVVVLNYELLDAHADRLGARRPRAVVFDESHYCKEPRAQRTQAALRLAERTAPDGLRLALTGTPILNRPRELGAQLRLLDRLGDFGSGARLGRRFRGDESLERLHWHLRAHCYVRRTKAQVLPQLPAKRTVTLPVALTNEAEYRLAERDVIAWLQTLPLDLRTLEAKVAAALRAERLVRLNHLRRLVAAGKLRAALTWIDDWRASGEPLVVFADHVEVQRAVLDRHPNAAHVLGDDDPRAREAAVRAFQAGDGPGLIVCSLRAAGQGITLTRASNVAFLELDWTPARLAQAEDRCHRMGQADAVTAWYLLAPGTIDMAMAGVLEHKRGVIGAVTDGQAATGAGLVDAVAAALRDRGAAELAAAA